MYRGQKIQRRKQIALTAALAAGLLASGASTGLFMATAAPPRAALVSSPTTPATTPATTPSTPSTPSKTTTTGASSAPSTSSSGVNFTLVSSSWLSKMIGEVVSSSGSTLVVKDQRGTLHTIVLTSSTTYSAHSIRVSRSGVGVRTIVFVQGTWNANHSVLRAQSIGVAGKVASGGDDSSGTDS